jgi:hypothetical protein
MTSLSSISMRYCQYKWDFSNDQILNECIANLAILSRISVFYLLDVINVAITVESKIVR